MDGVGSAVLRVVTDRSVSPRDGQIVVDGIGPAVVENLSVAFFTDDLISAGECAAGDNLKIAVGTDRAGPVGGQITGAAADGIDQNVAGK